GARRRDRRRSARARGSRAGRFPGTALLARPRLHRQAPQAHEAGGVLVAEAVGGVVGREVVAVEAAVGAATGHEATTGLEPEAHLAGDELLPVPHKRVETLLRGREQESVVHELGVAGLEPRLLPHEVALERDRLEI